MVQVTYLYNRNPRFTLIMLPVRQRLRLHLMFRTLDEGLIYVYQFESYLTFGNIEIEAVVHHIVEEATTNSIGLQHHREELTKKVCADVRTRPEWEDRYRVTRNVEVDIEANPEDPKDVKDIFTHICQVGLWLLVYVQR